METATESDMLRYGAKYLQENFSSWVDQQGGYVRKTHTHTPIVNIPIVINNSCAINCELVRLSQEKAFEGDPEDEVD